MTAETTNGQGQDASTTIGVGGATSGQTGATPSHETQAETGGSGGEALTASQGEGVAEQSPASNAAAPDSAPDATSSEAPNAAPDAAPDVAPDAPRNPAEPRDTSMHSGSRGALDTRGEQAGGTGTGLGSPESGANQSPDDLAPPAGKA